MISLSLIYYYRSRSAILTDSMKTTTETANQASHYLEQILKEKAKIIIAMSNAPVITEVLIKSNNEFDALAETERIKMISAENKKWIETKDPADPFIKTRMHNSVADFFLHQHKSIPEEFGEIFLTNRYGVMIATTKKLSTLAHAQKYWWITSFNDGKGRVFFDDRGFDESVDGYVLGIVVPIMTDNRIVGILKCNINILGAVSRILNELKGSITGEMKLLRSGGKIIYEEGVEPLSTLVCESVIVEMKKWTPSSRIHKDMGLEFLSSVAPVHLTRGSPQYGFGGSYKAIDHIQGNKGEGWYVLVEREVKDVLVPLVSMTKWIVIIGMIFIILMAITARYLSKRISDPIIHVARTAEKIGKRDFSARVNIKSKDELGLLANSINKMVSDLQQTTTSIDELNLEIKERKQVEEKQKKLLGELQEALSKVKTLSGFIPICASCKKIRDDKGYWNQVESYISKHSEAEFSHSICPECRTKLYPDLYPEK